VQVAIRPEAPIKGGRATLVMRKVQTLAPSTVCNRRRAHSSPKTSTAASRSSSTLRRRSDIEAAIRSVGDVERVTVAAMRNTSRPPRASPPPGGTAGGRSRHIRVDLRRLDTLMDLIGELVTERGRLNEVAAAGSARIRDR